mgnify:CR=1 FL=1
MICITVAIESARCFVCSAFSPSNNSSTVVVNSPNSATYASIETTAFGIPVTTSITSNIVLVTDGTALAAEGCGLFTNASSVSGKIALIRRGTCPFIQKCTNAVNAGAIAVIMINNAPGIPAAMGGTDTNGDVTIPSVAISKDNGDALVAALANGPVNVTINPMNSSVVTANYVPGIQHINDVVVRNNGGVSEIYVAAGDSFYSSANATTFLGGPQYGLYKSTDGGVSWTELSLGLTSNNNKYCPNDIEIGADNSIWLATTNSVVYGDGGGTIFQSTNGTNFVQKYNIINGDRTQIAPSATNAG